MDLETIYLAAAFNLKLLSSVAMQKLQPNMSDTAAYKDEKFLMEIIKTGIKSEYHPSGTCAMSPRKHGGVVNPELLVYGTKNLRVVDASIIPLLPAAHLQAVVYGIAEKVVNLKS